MGIINNPSEALKNKHNRKDGKKTKKENQNRIYNHTKELFYIKKVKAFFWTTTSCVINWQYFLLTHHHKLHLPAEDKPNLLLLWPSTLIIFAFSMICVGS